MFESTLEAQGLNDGERRLGSLSFAAFAHLAFGLAVVSATAMLVPPKKINEPHAPIYVISPRERPAIVELARPTPIARGTRQAGGAPDLARPKPPSDRSPDATPDTLPLVTEPPSSGGPGGPGEGTLGDPDGVEGGLPDGPGVSGDGTEGRGVEGPVYVTGDMVRPMLLSKIEPIYPEAARRARLGGRVTVTAVIGVDGDIESADVLASTNPLFDRAALDAVRKWRYRPATMNGGPVRVYFTVVVNFVVR